MATVPKDMQLTPDQYEVWTNRLHMAYKDRIPNERVWERLAEYYEGNYFDNESDHDRVTAPWHFITVRQQLSSLYFQDPSMNFVGMTSKGMAQAKISEEVAKFERRLIDADHAEREALLDALKYGTGIIKYAWNTQFGDAPAFADKQTEKGNIHGPAGTSAKDEALTVKQAPWTEHNLRARFGHPNVRAIKPWDFLIDPDANTYEEAAWVAHRFHRRWIDAKNDKRWDEKAREKLEPTGHSEFYDEVMDNEAWQKNSVDRDTAMSTFYEIWDKTTHEIIVVSPHVEIPLEVKPYPYQGHDGPYQVIQFFPLDKTFWALPYMHTFTPQVLADAKLKTELFDHLQRWTKIRGVYAKGRASEDDMQRLAETRSAEWIGMNLNFSEKLADILHIVPAPAVPPDMYKAMDKYKSDLDEVSGISENARGGGAGVQTATEANIISMQSGLRTNDMKHVVDKFLRGSVRKMMGLLRQFWGSNRVIPVVGPDGAWWDLPVSKETLNGDYDIDIEPGSTQRVDRAARFRQHLDLITILEKAQPLLIQQGKAVDFDELIRRLLVESDIIKNPDKIIFPISPQQMMGAQGMGQQQLMGPGVQGQPANVNGLDQIPTDTQAFQDGRGFSESQGAGV